MDARRSRHQKKISGKQEKRAAQSLGGQVQVASGAMSFAKGDVRKAGEIRCECKYTDKPYYIVVLAELLKIKTEANQAGEEPVLQVGFRDKRTGRQNLYAIVKWDPMLPFGVRVLTSTKSSRLGHSQLLYALNTRRYVIAFQSAEKTYDFEVLHWDDYLKRRSEDA